MISSNSELSVFEMTPRELKGLSRRLQDSLAGMQTTLVIGAASSTEAKVVAKVVNVATAIIRERRKALTESHIETLIDLYLQGEPLAQIDEHLERDNAALRARYLKQVPCLSATEIRAMLPKPPRNPSEPTSRWKREARVFAIPHGKSDLFPAFQFDHGHPLQAIRKILASLPADMTAWQIALWFATGNGWLDGDCPQACLSDVGAIVDAARHLHDPAVG